MKPIHKRRAALAAAFLATAAAAAAQTGSSSSSPIVMGTGGYVLDFTTLWTCDDSPQGTQSASGEVDLVNSAGAVVGSVLSTASGSSPVVTVSGPGTISGASASIHLQGAAGTPADGLLRATWTIKGPAPGNYSLRFWLLHASVRGSSATEITTQTMAAAGGGTVGGPAPTPTPSPTPTPTPPTVSLSAPASAVALQAFGISASASEGTFPLSSVSLMASLDGGSTWASIISDASPSNPSDSESARYSAAAAGSVLLRATAADSAGLSSSAEQTIAVSKAAQGQVAVTPASASVTAGQSIAFAASGGSTGNYEWGGAASGAGASQTVAFGAAGSFTVTALDAGNATYGPSAPAAAAVSVQPLLYILNAVPLAGGTATGGGSYPANALANALATPESGFSFAGWTGDVISPSAQISVLMNANKAVSAHFSAMLAQSISFTQPLGVTTRTAPITLSVSASSGLPVSLALDSGPATLSGPVVTLSGTMGTVVLTASQPGNSQFLPAAPVTITFAVGPAPPGLTMSDSTPTKRDDKLVHPSTYTSSPQP